MNQWITILVLRSFEDSSSLAVYQKPPRGSELSSETYKENSVHLLVRSKPVGSTDRNHSDMSIRKQ